jgi:hypothetical protein
MVRQITTNDYDEEALERFLEQCLRAHENDTLKLEHQ